MNLKQNYTSLNSFMIIVLHFDDKYIQEILFPLLSTQWRNTECLMIYVFF